MRGGEGSRGWGAGGGGDKRVGEAEGLGSRAGGRCFWFDLVRLCLFMCCCRCSCIQAGVAAFLVAGALLIKCRVYTGILVAGASITAFGGNLFSFVFSHTSLLFSMCLSYFVVLFKYV